MVTVRTRGFAAGMSIGLLLLALVSCSREQQDWRAAELQDTIQSYTRFIQRHPDSELVSEARTRMGQLGEDSDWQYAGSADTADAYKRFLAEHPIGRYAQEARIRMENFSLSHPRETEGSPGPLRNAPGTSIAAGGGGDGAATTSSPSEAGTAAGGATGASTAGGGSTGATPGDAGSTGAITGAEAGGATRTGSAEAGTSMGGAIGAASAGATTAVAGAATMDAGTGPADGTVAFGPTRLAGGNASQAGFGIQLGAFTSEAAADDEWRTAASRFRPELQDLHQRIVTVDTPTGRIYRLQADVGPETRARSICESLRKSSQACVPVLPH